MKFTIYTLRDSKAALWGPIWIAANDDTARRIINDILVQGESDIARHPNDFSLWKIGEYNQELGKIEPLHHEECIEQVGVLADAMYANLPNPMFEEQEDVQINNES